MTTNPYPEYKDSGTNWLGEVPAHWSVSPLGSHFRERKDVVNDTDFPPLSVTMGGIVPQLETAAKTDNSDNRKRVEPNDFVINSRSDRRGSSGVSRLRGSVSVISIVLEPKAVDPAFVHHLLRSQPFQEEFYRFGSGIVADLWSTRYSSMKQIAVATPPRAEQRQIANYLDAQTAKIDALVEKQEQLIETLAERRQAFISHAVTKGLNPDAPMKDSGVEWLGEIPEHWRRLKLGYVTNVLTGFPFKSELYSHDDSDARLLRGANVSPGSLVWDDVAYWPTEDTSGFQEYLVEPGDIILGLDRPIIGSGTRVARVTAKDLPALLLQRVARIRSQGNIDLGFLTYLLSGPEFRDYLVPIFTGVSVPHMSPSQLGDFSIALPNQGEQNDIVSFLDGETSKIDALSAKAREMVDVLKERRQALINAAVTGKIDVRGMA